MISFGDRPESGFPFSYLLLRQGVGWLGALRFVLVGLLERRVGFLQPRSTIRSTGLDFLEGRLRDNHSRWADQGSGFKLLVDVIVGLLGDGKGA